MKEAMDAVQEALKRDPVVTSLLGLDPDGRYKVYRVRGRKDVEPPMVIIHLLPTTDGPDGHFGDLRSIEGVVFQVSAWGRTENEAWEIHNACQDALDRDDMLAELAPYSKMVLRRQGGAAPTDDPDVPHIHLPALYQLVVQR